MKAAVRVILTSILAAVLVAVLVPYVEAALLLARAIDLEGGIGRIAAWNARALGESVEQIPTRHGILRARVYRPSSVTSPPILLVTGIHPTGIDESRLVELSRDLAGTGVTVVTPEITDLLEYRITGQVTDAIEDSARWLTNRSDLAPRGRLGILGVSFSGGLSIVAAGRAALRDRVAYVAAFGTHGNLPRVLRYLCTGIEPSGPDAGRPGAQRPPHDYGLAVILHSVADRLVPPEQAEPLRNGVARFLDAAALARTDRTRAEQEWKNARVFMATLPEPARTLLEYVDHRDVTALGPRLLPYIETVGRDPALSPDQSPTPAAPVYLLHGTEDNVIPAVETRLLAAHLKRSTRVRYLLTGLLNHADVEEIESPLQAWRLVAFWKAVLSET